MPQLFFRACRTLGQRQTHRRLPWFGGWCGCHDPQAGWGRCAGSGVVPWAQDEFGQFLQIAGKILRHGRLTDGPFKELEAESARLKKMYAEERLKYEIIQEAMAKKWWSRRSAKRWHIKRLLSENIQFYLYKHTYCCQRLVYGNHTT